MLVAGRANPGALETRLVPWCNSAMATTAPQGAWPAKRIFRALLLGGAGWLTLRLLARPVDGCLLDLVNLPFHEAGHVFLAPFGNILHVLGGTLGQLAVPGLLVWYFTARRSDPFASSLCLWWLGENLINVSTYMADARALALPLVGGGEHDWTELFFRWRVLDEDSVVRISSATRGAGDAVMLLGLAWGALFVLPRAMRSDLVLRLAARAPRAVRLLSDG